MLHILIYSPLVLFYLKWFVVVVVVVVVIVVYFFFIFLCRCRHFHSLCTCIYFYGKPLLSVRIEVIDIENK